MADFCFEIIVRVTLFLYALWIGGVATTIYNRIPNNIPIGPSQKPRCNNCKKEIKFKYFFPILGYFFSNGKCINCGMKIPKIYLYLELSVLFYILILSITFNTFDEKFISKSLYGSFIIVLMFIYKTHKQIKIRLIWMLIALILFNLGYSHQMPEIISLFINSMASFFAFLIFKKYIQISTPELQICSILITFLGEKISFTYLTLAILLNMFCSIIKRNLFFLKKINIVLITLLVALLMTFI